MKFSNYTKFRLAVAKPQRNFDKFFVESLGLNPVIPYFARVFLAFNLAIGLGSLLSYPVGKSAEIAERAIDKVRESYFHTSRQEPKNLVYVINKNELEDLKILREYNLRLNRTNSTQERAED